ncbi:MAG: hypothetical protein IPP90_12810 [Gemmatimonadaceae bacterium]|nr:hypothetical protein [Gemmatimonadaceae bacterium]
MLLSSALRHRRLAAWLGAVLLVGAGGCAPAATPRPAPTTAPAPLPVPRPAPVPEPTAAVRYAMPALVTDTRYRVRSTTELERDSAGRRDTQNVSSDAQIVVRLRRRPSGTLSATGRVYDYAVTSALSSTPIAIDSLRFDAVLDSLALRVAMQPPLVNECDRPESGALALVRDLLLRVPSSLAVGDTWRDSTVQLVCRASLPMIVRTVADYVVTDSVRDSGGVHLVIRRTSTTRIEGKTSSPWRAVEVTGTGTGTLDAHVSVVSGAVTRLESASSLTLMVTDRTSSTSVRAQRVLQRVHLTGTVIGS